MSHLITACVEQVKPLTDSILQVILKPDVYIDYQAGQYLQIIFEEEILSYSIANAPNASRCYELHIRHVQGNPYHQALLAHIQQGKVVNLRLPEGLCYLNGLHRDKPILFLAGGTGFAPIKAMIEQLLLNRDTRSFELFWSARSQRDLYLEPTILQWQAGVPYFQYHPYLPNDAYASLVDKVIACHGDDLHHWQMVLSGPFEMVLNMRDALLARNILRDNLFSDAF